MAVQFTPYTTVVVFSAVLLAWIAAVGWRRRDHPVWLPLAFLALGGALYAGAYAVQLSVTSLALKHLTWRVQITGWYVLLPSVFVFAVRYADQSEWLTRRAIAGVVAFPVVTIAMIWSPFFDLYLQGATLVRIGGDVYMDPTLGPWYTVDVGYSYIVGVASVLVVGRLFLSTASAYRSQVGVVAAGLVAPLGIDLARTVAPGVAAPLVHPIVDTIPISFGLTGIALAWGTYRYDLLEQEPIPTAALIEGTHNGVVVIGSDGGVIQMNAVARAFLDVDSPAGRSLSELSERAKEVADGLEAGETPFEMELSDSNVEDDADGDGDGNSDEGRDGDEDGDGDSHENGTVLEVRRSTLETSEGREIGELVTLVDVTDRARYEADLERYNQQIVLLNQMLRHDIRNDAAVAAGWSDLLAEDLADHDVPEDLLDTVERIRTSSEHIVELTNLASDLSKALEEGDAADSATEIVDVGSVLEREVQKVRSAYPEADVALPESLPAAPVEANELLGSVFGNLVRNAVVHSDREHPTVDVSLTRTDGTVAVTVADDGSGIEPQVRERLFEQGVVGERSSGMGLGLYLVRTLVTDFGGEVSIRDNEPRGTVFEVRLPLADA